MLEFSKSAASKKPKSKEGKRYQYAMCRDQKFYQIPQLTTANFPHMPVNFLRPQKPTKYALFVVGKLPQLTDTGCLPNKQAIFSNKFNIFNIPHVRTREAVIYLMAQSCLHVVVNFSWPPKPDQNMLYFSLFHRPLQNSA